MELKDKVAIITGASSGIGKAVAQNLNEAGVKFVLVGRREERLSDLKDELNHAAIFPCDISEPGMPERILETALDSFGSCDIVFNNAGVITTGGIEEININEVCYMVRVNVEAAFRMAYVALKHFKSIGSGYLINTSSVLGTKVRPTAGAYAGTKYAIEALTEALRLELAKTDIGVACIEPGLVKTDLHRDLQVHPSQSLDIPRPLQPEDVARMARFVLEQPDHVRVSRVLVLPTDHEL
jgi:NADP-dependent 3-hydroxy acid dehydrogenase YdfG